MSTVPFQNYPYSCIYKAKKIILIWQTSDELGDRFKVDDKNKLIFSNSLENLNNLLMESEKLHSDRVTEINFDTFWCNLKNLKPNRALSNKTCSLLLNGWNFIEDLLKTFSLNKELEILSSHMLNRCYKKLFYGNNLPSITPINNQYSPLWNKTEIFIMQKKLKYVWSFLEKKDYISFNS